MPGLLHPLLKPICSLRPTAYRSVFATVRTSSRAMKRNVLSGDEEDGLARKLADLPFKPFDFHGY
jgi:hypothetical protein